MTFRVKLLCGLGITSFLMLVSGLAAERNKPFTLFSKKSDPAAANTLSAPEVWRSQRRITVTRRQRFPARATIGERGDDEYPRLWQSVNENSRGRYDRYQAKTNRPIPVVKLATVTAE